MIFYDSKFFRSIVLWTFESVILSQNDWINTLLNCFYSPSNRINLFYRCQTWFHNWDVSWWFKFYWTVSLNRKTKIQSHWNKVIRLKSPERNSTMFRCNHSQMKSSWWFWKEFLNIVFKNTWTSKVDIKLQIIFLVYVAYVHSFVRIL